MARRHLCDLTDSKRKISEFSNFTFREHLSTTVPPDPLEEMLGQVHIAAGDNEVVTTYLLRLESQSLG